MIKFAFAFGLGALAVLAWLAFGSGGTEQKARAVGKVVRVEVSEAQYAYCRKEFLAETECFQKLPAEECVALIQERCSGTTPSATPKTK